MRVQVRGISGSGKTTLARELALRLGAPHVELDALVHGPGWQETPDEELRALLEPVLANPAWVLDGNYTRKLGSLVAESADTVVWLDLPLRVCLARALARSYRLIRTGEELWNGNHQTWRGALWGWDSLLLYAVRSHRRDRRAIPREVPAAKLVRLRSAGETRRWLARVSQ